MRKCFGILISLILILFVACNRPSNQMTPHEELGKITDIKVTPIDSCISGGFLGIPINKPYHDILSYLNNLEQDSLIANIAPRTYYDCEYEDLQVGIDTISSAVEFLTDFTYKTISGQIKSIKLSPDLYFYKDRLRAIKISMSDDVDSTFIHNLYIKKYGKPQVVAQYNEKKNKINDILLHLATANEARIDGSYHANNQMSCAIWKYKNALICILRHKYDNCDFHIDPTSLQSILENTKPSVTNLDRNLSEQQLSYFKLSTITDREYELGPYTFIYYINDIDELINQEKLAIQDSIKKEILYKENIRKEKERIERQNQMERIKIQETTI